MTNETEATGLLELESLRRPAAASHAMLKCVPSGKQLAEMQKKDFGEVPRGSCGER